MKPRGSAASPGLVLALGAREQPDGVGGGRLLGGEGGNFADALEDAAQFFCADFRVGELDDSPAPLQARLHEVPPARHPRAREPQEHLPAPVHRAHHRVGVIGIGASVRGGRPLLGRAFDLHPPAPEAKRRLADARERLFIARGGGEVLQGAGSFLRAQLRERLDEVRGRRRAFRRPCPGNIEDARAGRRLQAVAQGDLLQEWGQTPE